MRWFLVVVSIFFFSSLAWGLCPELPFFRGPGDLDLPCVDIDTGTCIRGYMRWDPEHVAFKLLEVEDTHRPIPMGPEQSLIPVFRMGELEIPVLVVDQTFEAFTGRLRLQMINNELYFAIVEGQPTEIPDFCRGALGVKGRCLSHWGQDLALCFQYEGSEFYVLTQLEQCQERSEYGLECPEGALTWCVFERARGNRAILFVYHPALAQELGQTCHP